MGTGFNHIWKQVVAVSLWMMAWLGGHAALSGTYTINNGAAASSTNYRSVSAAVSDLVSGIRADGGPVNGPGVSGPVVLRLVAGSGPYTEQVSIGAIPGVSAINNVRITGGPTRETIQFTNTTTTDRHVIELNTCKFLTLDSLTIVNHSTNFAYGIWIHHLSNDNKVTNCNVLVDTTSSILPNFAGINVGSRTLGSVDSSGSRNLIQGNYIQGGTYGVMMQGQSYSALCDSSAILDNTFEQCFKYGLYVRYQKNVRIHGNSISLRNAGSGGSWGIYFTGGDFFSIRQNKIFGFTQTGIETVLANFQAGVGTVRAFVANNMMVGGTATTNCYGIYVGNSANNINFYHNTVLLNRGTQYAIYAAVGVNNDFRNNILACTGAGAFATFFATNANNAGTLDYNIHWCPSCSNFVKIAGVTYTSASFIGGGGFSTNSILGSPNFVNPLTDLHIASGTLAYDAGTNLGITNDIDGDPRPLAPSLGYDIGADEYLPILLDAEVMALIDPHGSLCPDSHQVVSVQVRNNGNLPISNVPLTCNMTGPTTATLSGAFPGALAPGQTAIVTLGTISTWPGGNFQFEAYSSLPGDQFPANDTLHTTFSIATAPTVSLPDTTICGPTTLDAGAGAAHYLWSTGDTTQAITVNSSGNFVVQVTNLAGCLARDTSTVTLLPPPLAGIGIDTSGCPSIVFLGFNTGGAAATATWYFGDGQSATGLNAAHTYATNGNYALSLVLTDACGTDSIAASLDVNCIIGIPNPGTAAIALLPNPTSGAAELRFNLEHPGLVTVALTDLSGRIVLRMAQEMATGEHALPVDASRLPAGVYIMRVLGDDLSWATKLVKQ